MKDKKPIPSPPKPKRKGKRGKVNPKTRSERVADAYEKSVEDMMGAITYPDSMGDIPAALAKTLPGYAGAALKGIGNTAKAALGFKRGGATVIGQVKGGKVAKMAHGGGIELRGKTRGRIT